MRQSRGSILILVLFALVALSMVGTGFAYRTGLATRAAHNRAIGAQLQASAVSAAFIAMARLIENRSGFTHPAQPWHAHAPLASEGWLAQWSVGENGQPPEFTADYQVIDEEGKLNLSHASSKALTKLGMTSQQIASLFDWMDEDEIAQSQGAESDYYLSQAIPYHSKNAPLEFLDELLAVRGFGVQDYWGSHLNAGSIPAQDTVANNSQGDKSLVNRLGWVDLLTCVGSGKINLNTAPLPVLQALLLSSGAAEQIVHYRQFDSTSQGKLEDHAFRSDTDIDQLQGLTDADRDVLKGVAAFQSKEFRILAQATQVPSGMTSRFQTVVKIAGSHSQILLWEKMP